MATGGISGVRGGRLKGRKRFAETYSKGKTWGTQFLLIKLLPNAEQESCWGFAVGKRLGQAVRRNKLRRRLREITRQTSIKPGWDIVVVAREGAMGAEFEQLKAAVKDLLQRAGLLAEL